VEQNGAGREPRLSNEVCERDDIAGSLQQSLQTSPRDAAVAFLRRVTTPARAGVMRA